MDGRIVTAVALRIWGLILLLGVATSTPAAVLVARANSSYSEEMQLVVHNSQVAILFQLAASAILGLCLLIWAEGIARTVIPQTAPLHLGVDASQLLSIGLLLVGVVTLIQGLKEAASLLYVLATKPKGVELSAIAYLWERECGTVIPAAVNLLAGIILIFGRSGFARAWAQLRSLARTGHGVGTPS
jgi:hypothetical protein